MKPILLSDALMRRADKWKYPLERYEALREKVEKRVYGIFEKSKYLKLDNMGSIELDSLDAVEMILDLEEEFRIGISDKDGHKILGGENSSSLNSLQRSSVRVRNIVDYLVCRDEVK